MGKSSPFEAAPARKRKAHASRATELGVCQRQPIRSVVGLPRLLGVKSSIDVDRLLRLGFAPHAEEQLLSPQNMDPSVKSICIVSPHSMSLFRVEAWIQRLVAIHGQDLLRYKGVLNIPGTKERFIFQGVQHVFSKRFSSEWRSNESQVSKFTFIGRHLDVEALQVEFHLCRAEPHLRFSVGDLVMAAYVGGWVPGRIIKQWDETNAYRIELVDGENVWAPIDDDEFVRGVA